MPGLLSLRSLSKESTAPPRSSCLLPICLSDPSCSSLNGVELPSEACILAHQAHHAACSEARYTLCRAFTLRICFTLYDKVLRFDNGCSPSLNSLLFPCLMQPIVGGQTVLIRTDDDTFLICKTSAMSEHPAWRFRWLKLQDRAWLHGGDLEMFCEQTSRRIWGTTAPVCIVKLHNCNVWLHAGCTCDAARGGTCFA